MLYIYRDGGGQVYVRDRRHATTRFKPEWEVTDDAIVTEEPRLLLHHP